MVQRRAISAKRLEAKGKVGQCLSIFDRLATNRRDDAKKQNAYPDAGRDLAVAREALAAVNSQLTALDRAIGADYQALEIAARFRDDQSRLESLNVSRLRDGEFSRKRPTLPTQQYCGPQGRARYRFLGIGWQCSTQTTPRRRRRSR
jgi:hypothetical protein